MEDSRPIVFLVHGTWPRGILNQILPAKMKSHELTWFDDGSVFRTELQERLADRVQFEVFNWSGHNSMRARAEAAANLRDRLATVQLANPKSRQVIVAHSHGGNVAVKAIAGLDSTIGLLGVATMGTPFLYVRRRSITGRIRGTLGLFGSGVLLVFVLASLWLAAAVWKLPARPGAYIAMFIATCLFCIPLAIWAFWLAPAIDSLLKQTLADTSIPMLNRLPFLALRCPGDEASLALTLARAFAGMNNFAWNTYTLLNEKVHVWLPYPAIAWVIVAAAIMARFHDEVRQWAIYKLALVLLGPAALMLLAAPLALPLVCLFTMISGVLLLPFGSDLFRLAFLLEVRAEATPPVDGYSYVSVDPSTEHLKIRRHSVYAVSAARERLAKWIDALIAAR